MVYSAVGSGAIAVFVLLQVFGKLGNQRSHTAVYAAYDLGALVLLVLGALCIQLNYETVVLPNWGQNIEGVRGLWIAISATALITL
jgi:hypothetical protein